MGIVAILLIFANALWADINMETHDLTFEYGLAYHTVEGKQKSNNSEGRFTTKQMPYWMGSYSLRLGAKSAVRLIGGMQFLRFDEPDKGTLKNENQVLNTFGLEVMRRISPLARFGIFGLQQDHPVYFSKAPGEYEMLKKSFAELGLHYAIGQRRRVGLLWGLGAKGFLIYPTKGGNVTTESGVGTEAYARLGWVGPFGTLWQGKGFYQHTTAPNADVSFAHTTIGYCLQVSLSW